MLIRAFAALVVILTLGLGQGGPVDAVTYPGNPALSSLEVVAAGPVDQHRHHDHAGTSGDGNCHHASVPCAPGFLFQRNSALEQGGSSHSWAMPDGADLKPIALKRAAPRETIVCRDGLTAASVSRSDLAVRACGQHPIP